MTQGETAMAKPFVFFYLMRRAPDRIRETAPQHAEYWKSRELDGYSGGPFADRSGGLILFRAPSLDHATALADADPFVKLDLVESRWVKEWSPE
jgi:uncharacterized protein YciI